MLDFIKQLFEQFIQKLLQQLSSLYQLLGGRTSVGKPPLKNKDKTEVEVVKEVDQVKEEKDEDELIVDGGDVDDDSKKEVWLIDESKESGGTLPSNPEPITRGTAAPEEAIKKTLADDLLFAEEKGDIVRCTVYAPCQVAKTVPFLLLVYVHLKEESEEVEETAQLFDDTLIKKALKNLNARIHQGDRLGFRLVIKGVEIAEAVQEITWLGEMTSVEYEICIPQDYKTSKRLTIGTLYISRNSIPIGHIKFILDVRDDVANTDIVAVTIPKRYKNAFISYSSKNRDEVLKRSQMLPKLGLSFFQDLLSLQPGELWEKGLYKHIDKCDVFFLFWSTAAKESKWVTKEWEYALALQQKGTMRGPDIIPVPIEGPPPPRPPKALAHLHFNDTFIYFIQEK